jgi:hypothetical protein
MSYPQKSYLAPETQALLELRRKAVLQTPNGPTVAGQAVMEAESAQQMPPQLPGGQPPEAGPEQQGIAAILGQAQNAAPTIAQNQQNAQAEQTAQMAANMMAQKQQGPQAYAAGGIAALPIDEGDFAEGGVLGYAVGGIAEPTPESISTWVSALGPKADTEMDAEEKRLYEEQKTLQANRPDTAAQRAMAMKEAYNKEIEYRPTEEAILSFLGGAQGLGGFAKAAVDTRALFARRDAANKEGEQAQRDLEYAQKTGDNEKMQQSLAKRRLAKLEVDKLTNALAGDAMRAQTGIMTNKASIYNADLDARTAAANRKTQKLIAELGGVEGALFKMFQDNPEEFTKFVEAKAGGKTQNLKDPVYVANMVSDNVTEQMKNLDKFPKIGMKVEKVEDLIKVRELFTKLAVQQMVELGATLPPNLMKYVDGSATPSNKSGNRVSLESLAPK